MVQNAHADAVLSIHSAALVHNYHVLRNLAPKSEAACVVKANAYGLGIEIVAPLLQQAGCTHFFVATLDEALELRILLGMEATIAVFHGVRSAAQATLMQKHQLTPVLNSIIECALWRAHGRQAPALLHIDTGMTRLGIAPADITLDGLNISHLMSHLACISEPDHPLNTQQHEVVTQLRKRYPHVPFCFANSGGVSVSPLYHHDMVRLGCSLYGIHSVPSIPLDLQQVVSVEARIIQLRRLMHDSSIGYGATHHAKAGSLIATIPVGYADGYMRALSGHAARVWVRGQYAAVVGRVSMDLITVDVTAIENVQVGDMAELLGPHAPVDEIADKAGTIGYEILTRLGNRFARKVM